MGKVKLNVLGVSQSVGQVGAFTLFLRIENTDNYLRVIIGLAEAQSIAVILQKIQSPRPLSHDIFKSVCDEFSLMLKEVYVYQLVDNIFYSRIVFTNGLKDVEIDSRTSDAVALALRFNCPIFTNSEVIDASDEIWQQVTPVEEHLENENTESEPATNDIGNLSLEELHNLLKEALSDEDYEKASQVRDEIKKREQNL